MVTAISLRKSIGHGGIKKVAILAGISEVRAGHYFKNPSGFSAKPETIKAIQDAIAKVVAENKKAKIKNSERLKRAIK